MTKSQRAVSSDVPMLLIGEPGSGKRTLAQAVHFAGPRKSGPFEVLDPTSLEGPLIAQELLGFEEGAFAGAVQPHVGAAERAHRGTLYVSELSALDLESQRQLFETLSTGAVTPLGSREPRKVSIRIIAGTQYDPLEMVSQGKLREDLYYSLAVARIDLPPLRERETDIVRMAQEFLQEFREKYDRPELRWSQEVRNALLDCAWPGNVRQLRNVIEHSVLFAQGGEITLGDLPEDVLVDRTAKSPQDLTEDAIRAALRRTRGNRSHAAELLGVGRTTLWRCMKRYRIR